MKVWRYIPNANALYINGIFREASLPFHSPQIENLILNDATETLYSVYKRKVFREKEKSETEKWSMDKNS